MPEAEFAAYVAERRNSANAAAAHPAAGGAPPRLRTLDLYLACACARGDLVALAAFERAFFGEIDSALARVGRKAPPADEVRQLVRHKLFVGEGRPKIAEYTGTGDLRKWFRVTVTRLVLNLVTRAIPETPFADDVLVHVLGGSENPELEYAKTIYREQFRAAFAQAIDTLGAEDRSLLRYAFAEGLTVDELGVIYGVHRATAARWVVRAQKALVDAMRDTLKARLRLSDADYASILALVRSGLELSIERYLSPPDRKP